MNEQNLRPPFSPSEAREYGRKGAKASAETRRRKKAVKQALQDIFRTKVPNEQLEALLDSLGLDTSIYNAMLFSMTNSAIRGNVRAFEAVMKYAGEDKLREAEIKQISEDTKKRGGDGDVQRLIDAINAGAAIDWSEETKDE